MLLLLLWNGIAAFMDLLCLLWALHLSGEFCQLPYQTLIDETECLHLIVGGVRSSESVSRSSAVNVVLLVLRPRGVGVTPTHVSSRYHQSLRNQFICKGTVVSTTTPTDGDFSIDTGLEPLKVIGQARRTGSMYNLQPALKEWSDGGVSVASPMPKLVSFL